LDVTQNTPIVGTTFRTNFSNAYTAKTTLLNAIYAAAQSLANAAQTAATAAQTAVSNIAVGGVNLVNDSSFEYGTINAGLYNNGQDSGTSYSISSSGGYIGSKCAMASYSSGCHDTFGIEIINANSLGWQPNTNYMISFYSFASGTALGINFNLRWNNPPTTTKLVNNAPLTTNYQRYVFGITTGATVEGSGRLFLDILNGATLSGSGCIYFDCVQIEVATIATAWSPSIADVQSQITANQLAIANQASDGILSAGSEKSAALVMWNAVAGEYSGFVAQGTTYSSTKLAPYQTAYQNLANYLNGGTTWSSGTPLWLGTNYSVSTTIVPATYQSTWNAYYNAQIALQNDLYALAATAAVATLQVGGVNLIDSTNQGLTGWTAAFGNGAGTLAADTTIATTGILINQTAVSTNWDFVTKNINYALLKNLTQYTLSLDIISSNACTLSFFIIQSNGTNTWLNFGSKTIPANILTHVVLTGISNSIALVSQVFFMSGFNAIGTLKLANLMLTQGNTDVTWAASNADVQSQITANNSEIAQIAADTSLSPAQKLQVLQIWNSIISERSSLETQAAAFAVSYSSYESYYQSLLTYVSSLNLTNEATTSITSSTFTSYFTAYFTARNTLQVAISAALQSLQGITINGTAFIEGGVINAQFINAATLIAQTLETAASGQRITINEMGNNSVICYYPNGCAGITLGVGTDGIPRLSFYDASGNKIYDASQNGIVYVSNVPSTMSAIALSLVNGISSLPAAGSIDFLDVGVSNTAVNFFIYSAGNNAYTSNNQQYLGYIYTIGTINSSNQAPSSLTHIADGVYCSAAAMTNSNTPPSSACSDGSGSHANYKILLTQYSGGRVYESIWYYFSNEV
jgi:hypothetical protein